MNKRKTIAFTVIFILLSLAVMGVIYYFSSENGEESTKTSNGVIDTVLRIFIRDYDEMPTASKAEYHDKLSYIVRKGAHFTEYFTLALFLSLAIFFIVKNRSGKKGAAFLIPLCISVVYAIIDEGHQTFVSGRAGQVTDVLIDSAGALLSVLIIYLSYRIRRKKYQ